MIDEDAKRKRELYYDIAPALANIAADRSYHMVLKSEIDEIFEGISAEDKQDIWRCACARIDSSYGGYVILDFQGMTWMELNLILFRFKQYIKKTGIIDAMFERKDEELKLEWDDELQEIFDYYYPTEEEFLFLENYLYDQYMKEFWHRGNCEIFPVGPVFKTKYWKKERVELCKSELLYIAVNIGKKIAVESIKELTNDYDFTEEEFQEIVEYLESQDVKILTAKKSDESFQEDKAMMTKDELFSSVLEKARDKGNEISTISIKRLTKEFLLTKGDYNKLIEFLKNNGINVIHIKGKGDYSKTHSYQEYLRAAEVNPYEYTWHS